MQKLHLFQQHPDCFGVPRCHQSGAVDSRGDLSPSYVTAVPAQFVVACWPGLVDQAHQLATHAIVNRQVNLLLMGEIKSDCSYY